MAENDDRTTLKFVKSTEKSKEFYRNQIDQILREFELDPSDYRFRLSEESVALPGRTMIQEQSTDNMNLSVSPKHRAPPPPPRATDSPLDAYQERTVVSAGEYLRKVDLAENPPVKIVKPNKDDVLYRKEIRIRYLQPPTPPPPAPIIIRERQLPPQPPESPLLIRERKPEARTPPPLTIRERPPTPPPLLEPYIVEKSLPAPPPPPRQIIIERLPTPPPKPRTVIFEKWLPYKKVKRPVLLQKAEPLPPTPARPNVIIEYEPLKAYTVRRVIEEGIFRVDPQEYERYRYQVDGDVRMVDRIDDLPPPSGELGRVLNEYSAEHYIDSSDDYAHLLSDLQSSSTSYRQAKISSSPQRSTAVEPTSTSIERS